MHSFYLLSLLLANSLLLIDRRFRLAFFFDWRRTIATILPGMVVFVLWDILGIGLHIFYAGHSRYSLGVMLGKNFPIEEPLFLFLLCFTSLLLWRGITRYADLHTS
jgi:lycopene cyclase domain-containing protein